MAGWRQPERMARKRIVILGGGTGGTMVANRLRRRFDADEAEIHVVDRDDRHVYQPGLLFVPFGAHLAGRDRPAAQRQLRDGIVFHEREIDAVWIERDELLLDDGTTPPLRRARRRHGIASAAGGDGGAHRPRLERARLYFLYPGGSRGARDCARALRRRARSWSTSSTCRSNARSRRSSSRSSPSGTSGSAGSETGSTSSIPRRSTRRSRSPSPPSTWPACSTRKAIELVTEFNAGEVDSDRGKLISYDGRELDFDLLVTVPLHGGAAFIERSPGLGDALGFVPTDKSTLQSKARPNVFALGDAADLPTSKAGSVTHFEAEVLTENVARFLAGEELEPGYDGHANCFIETGFHKALLIDFNYETEPLPGHFPTALGLPLLRESRRQPPREAHVPVALLARAAPGPRPAGNRADDADRRQETRSVNHRARRTR